MAAEKSTRSKDITKVLLDQTYKEECEFKSTSKLTNGRFVIGRILFLCKIRKGQKSLSAKEASQIVASELREDWINKNVYPMTPSWVSKKILDDYNQFKTLCKQDSDKRYKKTEDWLQKVRQFNRGMEENAYDIRTKSSDYQKKLEAEFGVKMTDEDESFYINNCTGSYTATCKATVSSSWIQKKKREQSRYESAEKSRQQMRESEKHESCAKKLHYQEALKPTDDSEPSDSDSDFDTLPCSTDIFTVGSPLTFRTSTKEIPGKSSSQDKPMMFPRVKVRQSRHKINEKIIRCTVQCLADYRVSPQDLAGIIVNTANIIFNQSWEKEECVPGDEDQDDIHSVTESDDDEAQPNENDSTSKRRMSARDLTYVFPSRRTINRYLEDASYLNLHMVAEHLLEKKDNVVTIGLDDTTKAAGHKRYDVKADHITIDGPSGSRKTLTTGYVENISHSGSDGAAAYEFKLRCLAILANSSVEDIKASVDFWMSDRAADCATLLDNLGVSSNQIIKCSAHIILGVDHACDKVFRNVEQKIGMQKLLKVTAGEKVFTSPSTSVHTLAQIALTKLLSPSHAAHSISLYNEYTAWMEVHEIDHVGFKGFVSNRFGRIAEIAKEYLERRQSILDFFDAVVDVNANKLVLAVSTYIHNDWFLCCSEVYKMLGEIVIFPLMNLLGIDKREESTYERNWDGLRLFFRDKIPELIKMRDECGSTTSSGKERLFAAVIDEVIDTINRQLSEMSFFDTDADNESTLDVDENKLSFAPLTNLGCESEFAKLDNRISMSGGSTTVQTHSRKNVVKTNQLLVDSSFTQQSEEERQGRWKWARASEEVANVRKVERDFIKTVKNANRLSVLKKEELKKKKVVKVSKLLDQCKEHSGPVTPSSVGIVDELDEKQLLAEVGYLRATIAPDIRQMRRVKTPDGRFKMEKFSVSELRQSIKNAVKPEENVTSDIDSLLKNAL